MNTSNFDKHKVDHLFVLVGDNPLPNYVAARLLLHDGSTVHLVYTTRTKKRADLLEAELKKSKELNINITVKRVELGISWADGYDIRKKIQDKIRPKGKPPLQGRIGLNYTGGTKAMAVHAYQALLELNLPTSIFNSSLELELPNPVFSYLDSIKLQMCIDDNENRKTISVPAALAVSPSPKLEQILKLHDLSWNPDNPPIEKSQAPEAATEFAKQFMKSPSPGMKSQISGMWRKWCDAAFQDAKYTSGDRKGYWKKDSDIPTLLPLTVSLEGETLRIPEEIKKILREKLQCVNDTQLSIKAALEYCKFSDFKQVYQWLNGGWLEDYVLWQVENITAKYSIHEKKMSLHIQDPKNKSSSRGDQFEFDVAFLRGYQLYAISCTTTSAHDYCKEKLFEAYQRAQQLGGDEARIALVCCYEKDTNYLKQELSLVVDDRKIEVFGRSDLEPKNFARKLDAWIYRNI
jgi:hypothetical protein